MATWLTGSPRDAGFCQLPSRSVKCNADHKDFAGTAIADITDIRMFGGGRD
jgi:hypothetical protein